MTELQEMLQREILQLMLEWRNSYPKSRRPTELVGGQGLSLPMSGEGDGGKTVHCGYTGPFWENLLKNGANNNRGGTASVYPE